jgi:peroxiredoxin
MDRMKEMTLSQILEEAFEQARDMDAPLSGRLDHFADAVRAASPRFADAVDEFVARLKLSDCGAAAPAVGDPMPPFMLPDDQGRLVTLDDLLVKGAVALCFHRGHWCPYCRINTHALAEAQCLVEPFGGQIVGITPDLQRFAKMLKSDAAAKPFPILTDVDNGYALSLNLAVFVGLEMEAFMKSAGWDIPPYQGNDSWMLPIPATFIVDRDGVVRARFVDPDYRKRMAIEAVVETLTACQSGAAGSAQSTKSD